MRGKCSVHRKIFTRSPQARRATTRRQRCHRTTLNELSSGWRHHQYTPTCTYRNPATYTIATARLNGFPPAAQFKVRHVRLGCSLHSSFVKSFPRSWQSPVLAVSFASIKCNRRSMLLSLRERRSLHLCVCLRPRSFGHRSGLPPCKRVVWTAAPAQCVLPTATPRRSHHGSRSISVPAEQPMHCEHSGSSTTISCDMSCCPDQTPAFVASLHFVLPAPPALAPPQHLFAATPATEAGPPLRRSEPLSPPPRTSLL